MEVFGQKDGRFFKKGTQRSSGTKATDQTECHKCDKKGDCFSKTLVPSYQPPFQPKLLHSSKHKPKLRHTKDFEAKYNKVKAKLTLLSSSASSSKSSLGKNKGLIAETYEWDKEEVSSNENEAIEKKILGIDQLTQDTSSSGPKDLVFVKSSADNSKVSITGSNKPKLSKVEDSTLSNHDTGKWMNLQFIVPPSSLEKLNGVEPISRPKTIKSILKLKFTFKAETLKGIIINESFSATARGNKSSPAFKTNSAPAGKLKNVKMEDDPLLAIYHTGQGESSSRSRPSRPVIHFLPYIHCGYNDHKSDDCVYYPICEIYGSYDHDNHDHNRIISLRRRIKPRIPQHVTKNCETCGSNVHTTLYHNDIEWFRKREALQDNKFESFKARKIESSNALRSKTPTKKYQVNPKESHLMAVKRIFRYLKGTPSLGLRYPKCLSLDLKGYFDSDYAGCNMDRKSTSGACQLLEGKLVCWSAKKRQSIAMSSAEANNVATAGCCDNILWMKSQLTDYVIIYEKVPIFYDNTSAITISNNPVLHSITKHIDIRYHFIRDHILKGDIELHFIPTQYQLADIFTKPLDEPTFKRLIIEIEPFSRSPKMYKEYLAEFWYSAKALENSKVSFSVPTDGIYGKVGSWFETIGYGETVSVKGTLKKSLLPLKWRLKMAQIIQCLGEATKGCSSKAPTSSKTGHSKKIKESSSAMNSNLSQPPVSTPIDTGMHKEDQQATGGPTFLGVTSEVRANPQLSSGNDASAVSTAKADPGNSTPSDLVPQQQDQTKYVSEGLETVLTQPITGKGASFIARQVEEEEASNIIKLEDQAKLVSNVQPSFKDLDSPEDDLVIVVDDSDEDEENEVYLTTNAKIEGTSVPKSSSLSSLPTELKDLPSKFNELIEEVKGLKKQWELPAEFLSLLEHVASVQAKPKTLDALPSLLLNVTKSLNKFCQVLDSANSKARDQSVPSAGQANTMHAEEEKNTNQASISQLFQRRAEKNAEKENLNNQQPKPILPIITTTTQMQSPPL
ncbi:hypothetical protein Tco_0892284 [Tanacetum coccineum]|uniref:Retrovirus-related Pol polyprotein from transposon TNT 1-94 n=1 Tax=Tanacetum coccineum TaxID=301880 RepID=A0ABQ5C8G7_9ASTR